MLVLSVSDKVEDYIYHPNIARRIPGIGMVLACGDLPYYYIEYLVDTLNVPVYFVRGNHDSLEEYGEHGIRTKPHGAIDLHRKVVNQQGILLAGFQGSIRYRMGMYQYSQKLMWLMVMAMVPRLLINRLIYGRSIDILISHSPPWNINDLQDRAHQGFKALRWLITTFKPAYHFHGHVHMYGHSSTEKGIQKFQDTLVISTYGHKLTELDVEKMRERFNKEFVDEG